MAITKKTAAKKTETKKVEFKEVKHSGKVFDYSVRVYPGKEGKGKIKRSWGCQITLNGAITIKGVKLVETDSNVFFSYPQYQSNDKWNSYIYIDKELNEEIDAVITKLMEALGITDDDIAGDGNTELPF